MNLLRLFFPQKDRREVIKKYDIPDKIAWNVRLSEKGLVATSKDLPGLVTNGDSPEELLEMINDAVLEYFDVPKSESDYVFEKLEMEGRGTVYLKQVKADKQYAS
jgi:predicted RNase H-like HicB family nuclease